MLSRGPVGCTMSLSGRSTRRLRCLYQDPLSRPILSRSFHASRSNQSLYEWVEPLSHAVHWGFTTLHTQTGLPWYLTIPLGAALLRTSWIPFQIWGNKYKKTRRTLTQLKSAWQEALRENARIKFPGNDEKDAKQAQVWVVQQLYKRIRYIRKHQHYNRGWAEPLFAISFVPVWILSMDCIKRMAGDSRTVLSLLLAKDDMGNAVSKLPTITEPGFDSESLSWISSLASPDPLWLLPVSWGVLSTYSMWIRTRGALSQPVDSSTLTGKVQSATRTFSIGMLALPSCFTFVLINSGMPSAVVLYLLGTVTTQIIQRPLIQWAVGTMDRRPPLRTRVPEARPQRKLKQPQS